MTHFFATLKKEKLYQLDTRKMTMKKVKTEVWRFVQYYNEKLKTDGFTIYETKILTGEKDE